MVSKISKKKQKIAKKYAIPIMFLVIVSTVLSLLAINFPTETKEEDKILDNFLFTTNVSIFGIIFMIIKKAFKEKYIIDSLQILIFVMIPFSAFIPFLSDPKIFWVIFPAYFASVIMWFLSTDHFLIGKGTKINEIEYVRDDEQTNAASIIKRLFYIMMALSLVISYLYSAIIVNHPDNTLS